jgi:hypothetical protein
LFFEENEMKEVLNFIRGCVRPFISVMLMTMLGWLVFKGNVEGKDILQLSGIIFAFYFAERGIKKREEGE